MSKKETKKAVTKARGKLYEEFRQKLRVKEGKI